MPCLIPPILTPEACQCLPEAFKDNDIALLHTSNPYTSYLVSINSL